ncbi:hypothetical protein U1Q18_019837 [Sarracenia purpurea var. burkii]
MTTTVNPAFISYRNPKFVASVGDKVSISPSPTRARIFGRPLSFSTSASLTAKCTQGEDPNDLLSGMVDKRVDELLNREENRHLLDGLEKATQRLEMAKRELAQIEKQEIETKQLKDYIDQLESRTSEIAECQREILEARAMVEEAESSLNIDEVGSQGLDRNEERWESVKAASVSALVGSLAGLPISLTQVTTNSQLILPLAITFISCALFGVTYRYAVRRDLDNFQLKTGTSAAFGFVKGLATLDGGPPLELETKSFLSHTLSGAVYVSENVFVFVFAAVALDFCYKMRVLSPFPIQKSASGTD